MIERLFATGVALGLALGPACALTCAPVLGATLAGEVGLGTRARGVVARFLAGRLLGYAVFGAAAGGLLGGWLRGGAGNAVVAASTNAAVLALGLALLVVGARYARGARVEPLCPAKGLARFAGAPLVLGLLTGVSPCPPFLLAAVEAVRAGSAINGLAHFLGFFAGSSAFLLPALLLFPRSPRVRAAALRLGAAAAVLVGLFYALAGLRGLSEARLSRQGAPAAGLTEEAARRVLPADARLERQDRATFGVFRRPEGRGAEERIGFAVLGEAAGYAGPALPVAVVVWISPGREVLRAEMLPNAETPMYLAMLGRARFMERFRASGAGAAVELGEDIDAVSGATVTAGAVCAAVRRARHSLEATDAGAAGARAARAPPDVGWLLAAGFVLLVGAFAPRLRGSVRYIVLAASILLLGVWLGRFLSVAPLARFATGSLPPGGERTGILLFLGLLLGVTLWRGRVWCTHLCPFGALAELGGWACRARARTPRPLARAARVLPFVLLGAVSGAIAWTGRMEAAGAEPFASTFNVLSGRLAPAAAWDAAPAALALAALVLALSLVSPRFYCRHLCGAGAILKIVARGGARPAHGSAELDAEEHRDG